MKNSFIVLALLIFINGCSSVRLTYKGNYTSEDGRVGQVTYTNSYPVGKTHVYCLITAVAFGGACWSYFNMPFPEHIDAVSSDAQGFVARQLKTSKVSVTRSYVERINWEDGEEIGKIR